MTAPYPPTHMMTPKWVGSTQLFPQLDNSNIVTMKVF